MTIGLAVGTGYIVFASIATILGCLFLLIYNKISLFDTKVNEKILSITIPEDLDYTEVFNEEFAKYTKKTDLVKVKTTNMGSMFELTYRVELNDISLEKKFIDDLRIKNGNLKIMISHPLEENDL